ncbi:MAG: TonB-dependent receptor [Bacteroidota bacterium]
MKVKQKPLSYAIRNALYTGLLASIALSSVALAQDDSVEQLESTVVTGTNIRGIDLEGAHPVTIIEREELLASGVNDIGDLLQRLPSFSGSPLGTRTNNGGNGSVFVDLRGIGSGRTLVLIDGRRTVDGGDFQSIPAAMIQRVEILKEGASAIYGADAIAGVVNIITRSDFSGAEVEFSISDSFDTKNNEVTQGSFVFGDRSETGGFVFGLQYEDQSGTLQGDTPYEFLQNSYPIIDPDNFTGFDPLSEALVPLGSSRIPCGNFNLASGGPSLTINGPDPGAGDCGAPGRLLSPDDFREFNGGFFDPNNDTYNFAPINFLQTPFKKTNIFFNGHKEFKDIELFSNFRYNHRESSQQLAPIPYDSNFDPAAPLANGGNGISADNVFNPFGEDVTRVRRRMTETNRIFTQDIQQYQATIGARGDVSDSRWSWEASYNFGYRENVSQSFGQFLGSRLSAALGPSFFDASGIATCGTPDNVIAGCVPLNLFGGPGTVTPDMIEYISATLTNVTKSQLDVFNANISGIVFDLPAGPVGSAFGVEYRDQGVEFTPDSARVIGEATGGQVLPTSGSYDVTSLFAEFAIPIIDSDSLGQLDADLGIRYDDYSTVGSNTTLQGNIIYRPTDSIIIRATYAEVFREPGIFALFAGQNNGFPTADDPCNTNNFSSLSSEQQSICVAQSVPQGGWTQTDTQLRQLTGGNPNLAPEEGETITVGLAWSPEFLEGFTSTIDWWQVDLNQGFTSLSIENTVLNCLNSSGVASLECSLVNRRSDGSIISVSGQTLNAASVKVEGVDVGLTYLFATDYGQFNIGFNYTKLIDNQRQAFAGSDVEELAGRYSGQAYNDERAKITAIWNYDNWTVNYSLDYYSDLVGDLQFFDEGDLIENGGDFNTVTQNIPSQSYSDIAVSYAVPWYETSISVGINNMFDRDPPFIESGFTGSTEPATYRVFGRTWFVRWKTRF